MRAARRATLLVAFSLLTSAATAHAECAWVLWRMEYTTEQPEWWEFWRPAREWSLQGAAPSPSSCMTALRAAQKSQATLHNELLALFKEEPSAAKPEKAEATVTIVEEERRGRVLVTDKDKQGRRRTLSDTTFMCLPDTVDPRGPKGK